MVILGVPGRARWRGGGRAGGDEESVGAGVDGEVVKPGGELDLAGVMESGMGCVLDRVRHDVADNEKSRGPKRADRFGCVGQYGPVSQVRHASSCAPTATAPTA